MSPPRVVGQSAEFFRCPEGTYAFTGSLEQTLCEQYSDFTCEIQIGAGTPFPKSSDLGSTSLSGNVCVVGDFEVDNLFTFQNAVVKIQPGVTISVAAASSSQTVGGWLVLNSCKLFACNGLWKSITLGYRSGIQTYNRTRIEDAEKAIYASGYCVLYVEQTTFNRNRIGIELETLAPFSYSNMPSVVFFANNRFTCSAPLNGTSNEITEAGVKLKNSFLYAFLSFGFNWFFDLKYGIYSEGNFSHIGASRLVMQRIKKDCIYMKEGFINLRDSHLYTFGEKGVNIEIAKWVNIKGTRFSPAHESLANPNAFRLGIHIVKFALNTRVKLDSISFIAGDRAYTERVIGVHLKGGNIGSGTQIVLSNSYFSIKAHRSYGLFLSGHFPASTETHIYMNQFATGSLSPSHLTTGIYLEGDKNNLNIYNNSFTGNGYWNFAIYGKGSSGFNNYIAENEIVGTHYIVTSGEYFSKGFFFSDFQNTTFCSNINRFGSNYAFEFWGLNPGTDFVKNKVYATAVALDIFHQSLIGPQEHKGNEWHPVYAPPFVIRAAYHARCQTESWAGLNKFIVHTAQSVWNASTASYDFFSEYHPENILPDVMDEFFSTDSTGTPPSICSVRLRVPNDSELDKIIADNLLQVPADDPSVDWIARGYLYRKLKGNPHLVGTYPSYAAFLSAQAHTNIGRFYEVDAKIAQAFTASDSLERQSRDIWDEMEEVLAHLIITDCLLENTQDEDEAAVLGTVKIGYLERLRLLQVQYDAAYHSYWSAALSLLEEALLLNLQIIPTNQLEANEKSVKSVWLESLLYQSDSLTESQIAGLRSIGQQCRQTGGLAVYYALALLPDCEREGLSTCEPIIVDDADPVFSYAAGERGFMDSPPSPSPTLMYPNPAISVLSVELPDGGGGELQVYDVTGKMVLVCQVPESRIRLEVGELLKPGIYWVRVQAQKGTSHVGKLIILSK